MKKEDSLRRAGASATYSLILFVVAILWLIPLPGERRISREYELVWAAMCFFACLMALIEYFIARLSATLRERKANDE